MILRPAKYPRLNQAARALIPRCMQNALQIGETAATMPRLPVRTLVEIQCRADNGESDLEIAAAVGLDPQNVTAIMDREHWRDRALVTPESEKAALNADTVLALRWQRAVQARARLLVFAGLDLAGAAADNKDARAFKDAAQGAKLMHDIATGDDAGEGKQAAPSIVAFFIEGERRPEAKAIELEVSDF